MKTILINQLYIMYYHEILYIYYHTFIKYEPKYNIGTFGYNSAFKNYGPTTQTAVTFHNLGG